MCWRCWSILYDRVISKSANGRRELASAPLRFNVDAHAPGLEIQVPETSHSRISVLATLQDVEYGAERLLTRRLVFFEAVRFSCQACDALC